MTILAGPIRGGEYALSEMCRPHHRELQGDMTNVRACFVVKKHRLVNERLYHEWVKVKQKSDLAKKSIALRWKNERNTNVIRTQYERNTFILLDKFRKEA